jgi:hypothetical protein
MAVSPEAPKGTPLPPGRRRSRHSGGTGLPSACPLPTPSGADLLLNANVLLFHATLAGRSSYLKPPRAPRRYPTPGQASAGILGPRAAQPTAYGAGTPAGDGAKCETGPSAADFTEVRSAALKLLKFHDSVPTKPPSWSCGVAGCYGIRVKRRMAQPRLQRGLYGTDLAQVLSRGRAARD